MNVDATQSDPDETPIVVGIDESRQAQRALRTALGLARTLDSKLTVVSAYEPREEAPSDAAVRGLLDEARDQAQAAGVAVECVARHGAPVPAIVSVAAERDAWLVIVGSRALGGGRRSVPRELARQAPCSVLIVDAAA